jgi:hypothetical protein
LSSSEKKKKHFFHHLFKNVIVSSKVIEKSSIDSKGTLRAFQWKHQRDKKQRGKAQLQDQVTFFIIYFPLLIKTNFYLDYKNKELLNASLFSMKNLKKRKTKKAVEVTLEFPINFTF